VRAESDQNAKFVLGMLADQRSLYRPRRGTAGTTVTGKGVSTVEPT